MNEIKTIEKMNEQLKPCPFCGDNVRFEVRVSEAFLACNGCPIYFSITISDLMTYEECREARFYVDEKFINRAKKHLIQVWNTRAPTKDRELLVAECGICGYCTECKEYKMFLCKNCDTD